MDAEGFGSQTAADPPATPGEPHEKQTVGTVTASHKILTLQALSSSLNCRHCKERLAWAEERLLGDLRQSVPQNSRVHLHTHYRNLGDRFLSSAGTGRNFALSLSMRVAKNCSPVLDKNPAPMGPEILSSTGAGVWSKAPKAFPDSSSVLDKFQSATIAIRGENMSTGSSTHRKHLKQSPPQGLNRAHTPVGNYCKIREVQIVLK